MLRTLFHSHMHRSAAAAIALAAAALVPAQASAQFGSVFFFGDSFTDVGSAAGLSAIYHLPNPTPPPYAPGRFTNGLVYSEIFASRLGHANDANSAWVGTGNNYAIGGATTGIYGAGGTPTGMNSQIAKFTTDHPNPALIAPNSLFVLFGGGNDIIDAVALSDPAARMAAVQVAANNILSFTGFLATSYGIRNFLIPLVPDVGSAPLYGGDPASATIASGLTATFDGLVSVGIQGLDGGIAGLNARTLNLNNILTNIRIDAATGGTKYGITNLAVPCFTPANPPISCASSLFVDHLHPTSPVEQLFADAAYNRVVNGVDVSVVPEPSTIVLMAAGLGLLAMAGGKRKKVA
jgi:phospholipase/lecithinase/hemolysin